MSLKRYNEAKAQKNENIFILFISVNLFGLCVALFDTEKTLALEFVVVIYIYVAFLIWLFWYYGKNGIYQRKNKWKFKYRNYYSFYESEP